MAYCCSAKMGEGKENECPLCKKVGQQVKIITLKSLLCPHALAALEPDSTYYFCRSPECEIVYFNQRQQAFTKGDVKVPVFQKDSKEEIPICYCFGWTRQRITEEMKQMGKSTAVQNITMHIKERRCGCEVNNPQGTCCLRNVTGFIQELEKLG